MDENAVNTEPAAESAGAGTASSESDKDFMRGLFGEEYEPEENAAESGEPDGEEPEDEDDCI